MILTGKEIHRQVRRGRITISPFHPAQLNPNSYNYRLGRTLKTACDGVIDARSEHCWERITIPDYGLVLEPGRLYLGHTVEAIGSRHYVTSLIGRSSVGRLGLYLQLSADLAQLGAIHRWTLELTVVQPLKIYPGVQIGQVSFWVPAGPRTSYSGLYGNTSEPLESQHFRQWEPTHDDPHGIPDP